MSTTPLTDGMQALINYANETTGETDTTLSDAIDSLVSGYGSGGGSSGIGMEEFDSMSFTLDADYTSTNVAYVYSIGKQAKTNIVTDGNAHILVGVCDNDSASVCAIWLMIILGSSKQEANYIFMDGKTYMNGPVRFFYRGGDVFVRLQYQASTAYPTIPAGTYTAKIYHKRIF